MMPRGSLRRFPVVGATLAFLTGLLLAGLLNLPGFSQAQQQDSHYTAGTAAAPTSPPAGVANLQSLSEAFASVAEAVKPSVVFIKSGKHNDASDDDQPQFQLPPGFEQFMPRLPQMQPQFQEAAGSGFIVSRDGYILTNAHVVDESDEVTVRLLDRREFKAKVVGTDEGTDLAVLKIDANNLTPAPLGDSDASRVGEWVLAVGNPYQLNQTVTLGIVSAVGRTNLGVSTYEDFIQTDAAINPGNSGGALVNARGELVGINTVIFSQSGGYQGIGFAVSSNLARRVVNDLQQYQEVRRGTIGLSPDQYVPLTTRIAEEMKTPDTRGALIYRMYRNSPAYQGGLRPGDVVVGFNGTAVEDPGHLSRLMSDAAIGSTASVSVIREGRRVELKVPVVRVSRN